MKKIMHLLVCLLVLTGCVKAPVEEEIVEIVTTKQENEVKEDILHSGNDNYYELYDMSRSNIISKAIELNKNEYQSFLSDLPNKTLDFSKSTTVYKALSLENEIDFLIFHNTYNNTDDYNLTRNYIYLCNQLNDKIILKKNYEYTNALPSYVMEYFEQPEEILKIDVSSFTESTGKKLYRIDCDNEQIEMYGRLVNGLIGNGINKLDEFTSIVSKYNTITPLFYVNSETNKLLWVSCLVSNPAFSWEYFYEFDYENQRLGSLWMFYESFTNSEETAYDYRERKGNIVYVTNKEN